MFPATTPSCWFNCVNRAVKADPAAVVRLDDERKRLIAETQTLQQRANELSKRIPQEKDPAAKQALIAEGKQLREQVGTLDKQVKQAAADLHVALLTIPNMTHSAAPVGHTAAWAPRLEYALW